MNALDWDVNIFFVCFFSTVFWLKWILGNWVSKIKKAKSTAATRLFGKLPLQFCKDSFKKKKIYYEGFEDSYNVFGGFVLAKVSQSKQKLK